MFILWLVANIKLFKLKGKRCRYQKLDYFYTKPDEFRSEIRIKPCSVGSALRLHCTCLIRKTATIHTKFPVGAILMKI